MLMRRDLAPPAHRAAARWRVNDEAMKGGRKDVRVAMISTQLLMFELAQRSLTFLGNSEKPDIISLNIVTAVFITNA